MSSNDIDANEQDLMQSIRSNVVEQLLKAVFVLAVFAAPISISRFYVTGWVPLYSVHLGLALIAISTYLVRQKLPTSGRIIIVLGLFSAVGIGGLIQLGLLGVGMWWLVVTSLIMSVLYSPRVGLMAAATTVIIVLVVAYLFVNGVLSPPVDANAYLSEWTSWLTLIIATSIMPVFVFQSIGALQSTTRELLIEVTAQRNKIHQLATYDELTGLLRPHVLSKNLKTLIAIHRRNRQPLALMFVDLDGFKPINDTYGHDMGDHVLKELGKRYQDIFRMEDAIGRIGGDEFIFVFGSSGTRADIENIAKRLIKASTDPVEYEGRTVSVGASVGISLFPDHSEDGDMLRKLADKAMYRAKRSGGTKFKFAQVEGTAGEAI